MLRKLILALVMAACLAMPAGRALAAEEHSAAASSAGHEEHKKPDLVANPFERETQLQALWVIIIFVVLLAILYPTAWKNVLKGLKAREERIRKDIADAEEARAKAEATLREYSAQLAAAEGRVREMLNNATKDGERIATKIKMDAQGEAEEAKKRATKDIETAKQQALSEIYQTAAELSTSIAEKILRRNINAEDQKDLVKRSLDELQTVAR
ncbi:MAG TPA: F0F1 ATP synthase subunit B [Tepidisphaeraceae bacterium]|nr:F0F1 ATP synthase subunit B [Tepidisphaeraceae bacterium]